MPQDDLPSTKPYLIRAIHEWCSDNGFTPYLGVAVDASVDVPMAFVTNDQIVLNVSYGATDALKIGNELITFKGRFNGQVKDLMIPVARVVAVYAKENAQGMAFEATEAVFESQLAVDSTPTAAPVIALVKKDEAVEGEPSTDPETDPPNTPVRGGLRRVK